MRKDVCCHRFGEFRMCDQRKLEVVKVFFFFFFFFWLKFLNDEMSQFRNYLVFTVISYHFTQPYGSLYIRNGILLIFLFSSFHSRRIFTFLEFCSFFRIVQRSQNFPLAISDTKTIKKLKTNSKQRWNIIRFENCENQNHEVFTLKFSTYSLLSLAINTQNAHRVSVSVSADFFRIYLFLFVNFDLCCLFACLSHLEQNIFKRNIHTIVSIRFDVVNVFYFFFVTKTHN